MRFGKDRREPFQQICVKPRQCTKRQARLRKLPQKKDAENITSEGPYVLSKILCHVSVTKYSHTNPCNMFEESELILGQLSRLLNICAIEFHSFIFLPNAWHKDFFEPAGFKKYPSCPCSPIFFLSFRNVSGKELQPFGIRLQLGL